MKILSIFAAFKAKFRCIRSYCERQRRERKKWGDLSYKKTTSRHHFQILGGGGAFVQSYKSASSIMSRVLPNSRASTFNIIQTGSVKFLFVESIGQFWYLLNFCLLFAILLTPTFVFTCLKTRHVFVQAAYAFANCMIHSTETGGHSFSTYA